MRPSHNRVTTEGMHGWTLLACHARVDTIVGLDDLLSATLRAEANYTASIASPARRADAYYAAHHLPLQLPSQLLWLAAQKPAAWQLPLPQPL